MSRTLHRPRLHRAPNHVEPAASGPPRPPEPRRDRQARRFARLWPLMDASIDELFRPLKVELFANLPAEVVEIGPGRGTNFAHFPRGTRVIAFEPNAYFHEDLRAAAAKHGIELDLLSTDLRSAGLPDASQDVVISTLVLCSVRDADPLLAEIRRVLRPGGRLVFLEHVAAPAGSGRALYQRLVRRPWGALADGCDPAAETVARIARSGLSVEDARLEPVGSRLDPTRPTYWGSAYRR